jgi:hypothetical protein
MNFSVAGQTIGAQRWVSHPQWRGYLGDGTDLGIIELARPVVNVAPAGLYGGGGELGQSISIVGFGGTGNGRTGTVAYDQQKRMIRNTVDELGNPRILMVDFDSPNRARFSSIGGSSPLRLEGLSSFGDSGGGLFLNQNGWSLAGVTSFIRQGSASGSAWGDYGDLAGYTRVSPHLSWIHGVLGGRLSGSAPGIYARNGNGLVALTAVPEPASLAIVAVILPAALLTRRRR